MILAGRQGEGREYESSAAPPDGEWENRALNAPVLLSQTVTVAPWRRRCCCCHHTLSIRATTCLREPLRFVVVNQLLLAQQSPFVDVETVRVARRRRNMAAARPKRSDDNDVTAAEEEIGERVLLRQAGAFTS